MAIVLAGELENQTLRLVVKVARLDASTAREFKRQCQQLWPEGVESVTIDLAAVETVDTSGIGALLSIYRRLGEQAGPIALLRVKPPVQTVIELLRLHRVLRVQS